MDIHNSLRRTVIALLLAGFAAGCAHQEKVSKQPREKAVADHAKDYPGVRIDLDPLPEMEKRKRAAISKDRARYFAPVIGHGGREYERTVLIGYANGLNHERHLCQVMAEAEPDANLKKFLLDAQMRYDDLYDRVTALLDKDYFKDPNGKTRD